MPVEVWHEAHQGSKRTSAKVLSCSGGKILNARSNGSTFLKGEFANGSLQEGNLAAVRIDQPDLAITMADSQDKPRQATAASDVQPEASRSIYQIG